MSQLPRFWKTMTEPRATDQDEARQEYMSKVILAMTGATVLVCTVPIIIGWLAGTFDFVPVVIMLTLDFAVGIAYWLAHRGYWRYTVLIPVAIFFLVGLYGNYTNGLATILNFFYVLVILLTAMFCGWLGRLVALGMCIVVPLLIELLYKGATAEDFLYGGIPFAGLLVGVALLQWFFTERLQHALAQARAYAAELDEHRDHLEELVKERYQDLQREIAERQRAEEALRRAHSELEDRVVQRTAALTEANAMLKAEVAERRRVESQRESVLEALRESEGRYSQLLKHAPAGIYEIDVTNSRFTSVNDVMCEYTGYTREEFLSLNPMDVLTEESKQHFFERYQKIVAGEEVPDTAEFLIKGKNDREFWVLLNSKFTYGEDGSITAMVVIHDITERKRAEEELRQSMAELQNLQHITNALLSLDELSQVMTAVAKGIVDHLGFDIVLLSRFSEVDQEFSGLALYPIPGKKQFSRLLKLIGHPDLIENPTRYRLAYQKGKNSIQDRILDGESVISDALADFFYPWVPKAAALATQKSFGMESFIDLPLQVKGKSVGTILAGVSKAPITTTQQQALARVSRQAAVAIENARLYDAESQRSEELARSNAFITALSQVSARIETTPAPDQILETLGTELKRLGITYFLAVLEPDTRELVGHYASVESLPLTLAEKTAGISIRDFRMTLETKPLGQVLESGQALFVPDLIETTASMLPQLPEGAFARVAKVAGVTDDVKAIYLPLKVEDRPLGVMAVWSEDLREEDVPALSIFAGQVAVALENAQLMQDLEKSLSELKEAQAQLIQAQKIEAVGRLAGGVAHDFNNLLTIIQVNTQLLMRQLRPEDPLFEYIKQIQQADERAADLTQQLLRFGRQEPIKPQPVNLNQTIGDLERMLRRLVGDDIELISSLADNLWLVKVDPAQMEQMMVNLVMNARDAMPLGGCLSIETANVVLDKMATRQHAYAAPGEYVMLAISDTGTGMDEHVKARVFEPFFTTKEQGRGTGLGLSTVYGIVKQNAGHVWVYSEVGQGTTFKIYLPCAEEAVERIDLPSRKPQPAPVQGSETILVVEDEKTVRKLAVQILQSHGYQVFEAGDGIEALEVSEQTAGPIHLLLTDVVMPRMNGRDLAQRLQAERDEVRVLYVSGYSDDVIEHHGILETGAGFLPKPFTLEALTEKVRTILDSPL